jgi:hypothetical protein
MSVRFGIVRRLRKRANRTLRRRRKRCKNPRFDRTSMFPSVDEAPPQFHGALVEFAQSQQRQQQGLLGGNLLEEVNLPSAGTTFQVGALTTP